MHQSMTEAARMARSRNLKIKEMTQLEQQVRGYHFLHQREREQTQELRMELAHRYIQPDPLDTAADRIWADFLHNCDFPPQEADVRLNRPFGGEKSMTSRLQLIKQSRESYRFQATVYYYPSFSTKRLKLGMQYLI
jgi:hypothetical protein